MLAYLDGKLAYKDHAYVILDVNGLGYEVRISLQTFGLLPALNSPCKLHVYLSIREDAHVLYGFWDADEKAVFLALTGISGIGPSTALVMLSSMSAGEIRRAIVMEEVRVLQSIKGLGPKTAQRVILELRDKFKKQPVSGEFSEGPTGSAKVREEALSALVTLGIPRATAEKSVDTILKKEGVAITVEQLIKLALR